MKTTLVMVAGAFLVGAMGIAWHAAHSERVAEADLADVRHREISLNAEIQRVEARVTAAEGDKASWRSMLEKLRDVKPAATIPALAPQGASLVSTQSSIGKSTESQERAKANAQLLRLAEQRVSITKSFRPLFTKLGLSPAQGERFVDITMKDWEAGLDLGALEREGVLSPNDPSAAQLRAKSAAQRDAAYLQLLGEDGYQQWQDYARSAGARRLVQNFAAIALMEGAPFSAAQLEPLVTIVANGDGSYRSGQSFNWSLNAIDWATIDAKARPLMTDAQWEIFTTVAHDPGFDRFWSQLRGAVSKAEKIEAASRSAKPPGG